MPLQAAAIPKLNISFWNALLMVRAIHLRVLPETRGECRGGARPCPMVSCRYHLLLDVAEDGRLFVSRDINEHDTDSIIDTLREMAETCALDVAERGGVTLEDAAEILGVGTSSVEKTQISAARAIRACGIEFDEREHPDDFYARYSNMGADELAEVAATLRARSKFGGGGRG
jgi:hypothetical protein